MVRHFHALGTRAITVSGGGEPTLHPGFDSFIDLCGELDVHVGLITNGLQWSDKPRKIPANGKLIWARMSIVDSESGTYDVERLRRFSENLSDVAVGCYATITKNANVDFIERLADMAEALSNVTHFKLGENSQEAAPEKMAEIKRRVLPGRAKVIVQSQSEAGKETNRCLVSLLRPVVAADGYVYPCCDLNLKDAGYVDPVMFRMGHWRDFGPDTKAFNGSICQRCIWSHYNEALDSLMKPLEHERFL